MHKHKIPTLVAALALLLAACGGDDTADTTTTAAATPQATTTVAVETTSVETTVADTTTTVAVDTTQPATTVAAAGDDAALAALRASLAETGEASSGRMEGSFSMTGIQGLPSGGELVMPFGGAFDNTAGAFAFTMDLAQMMAGVGEEIPPELAAQFGEMEIRQIGETTYLRFPLFSTMLGAQTEWVATPTEGSAAATEGFTGATPANPTDFLAALESANAAVEEVGGDTVRGVATTHYRVTFDMETLLENATPEERAEIEAQGPLPIDQMPMDVWIGDDGFVYKYVIDLEGSQLAAAEGQTFERMVMTFEMYDYGSDVQIDAPPADQITEVEDLESMFGSFGG